MILHDKRSFLQRWNIYQWQQPGKHCPSLSAAWRKAVTTILIISKSKVNITPKVDAAITLWHLVTCFKLIPFLYLFNELVILLYFVLPLYNKWSFNLKHTMTCKEKNPAYGRHWFSRSVRIVAPKQWNPPFCNFWHSAVQCSAVQCSTSQCSAVQCSVCSAV